MAMSGATNVGAGVVTIKADDTQFKKAMNDLPATAQQKIDIAMKSIQDRIAKARFAIFLETDPDKIRKLWAEIDLLGQKLNKVKLDAIDAGDAQVKADQRAAESAQRKADTAAKAAAKQAAATAKAADATKRAAAEAAAAASQSVSGSGVVVPITADPAKFAAAMKSLPAMAAHGIDQTMRAIEARMNANRAKFAGAQAVGDTTMMAKLDAEHAKLGNRMNDVKLNAIQMGDSIQQGSSRGARGLYALGAGLDDLQYGLQGVLNNIPQIAMAFGAAGLAGAIAIAVTAAYQLYKNWDMFMDIVGMGKVKTQAEEMKELADQTERTATEQERLNKANLQEKTKTALQESRPEREEKSSKASFKAIEDQGFGRVRDALEKSGIVPQDHPDAKRDKIASDIKWFEDKLRKFESGEKDAIGQGIVTQEHANDTRLKIDALKKQLTGIRNKEIGNFIADASNSVGGRRESLIKDIEANPERYGEGKTAKERRESGVALADKLRSTAVDRTMTAEEDRKHKRLLRKSQKQDKDFETEEGKDVARQAESMSKGKVRREILQNPDADETEIVRKQMIRQGIHPDDIKRQIDAIVEQLNKKIEEDLADYGAKEGVTREEAVKHAIAEKTPQEKREESARKAQAASDKSATEPAGRTLAKGKAGKMLLGNIRANVVNEAVAALLAAHPDMSLEEAVRLAPMVAKAAKEDVAKRVSDKQAKMAPGTTFEQAAAALAEEDKFKLDKKKQDAIDDADDAQERVHDAKERVQKIWKGDNKPQFMGGIEHLKAIQLGALGQEDQGKQMFEAMKDVAKAERNLAEVIAKKDMTLKAVGPED